VTYDAVFTEVKWPNSVWLTLNCVISSKLRKPALCPGCHGKNLSWFSVLNIP